MGNGPLAQPLPQLFPNRSRPVWRSRPIRGAQPRNGTKHTGLVDIGARTQQHTTESRKRTDGVPARSATSSPNAWQQEQPGHPN